MRSQRFLVLRARAREGRDNIAPASDAARALARATCTWRARGKAQARDPEASTLRCASPQFALAPRTTHELFYTEKLTWRPELETPWQVRAIIGCIAATALPLLSSLRRGRIMCPVRGHRHGWPGGQGPRGFGSHAQDEGGGAERMPNGWLVLARRRCIQVCARLHRSVRGRSRACVHDRAPFCVAESASSSRASSLGTTLSNKQKEDVGFTSAAVMGVLVRPPHSLALTRMLTTTAHFAQGATLLAKGYGLDEEELKL